MLTEKKNPRWWQLYVTLPVLAGLFWPETRANLTQTEHIIAELGILALIFGFVQLWLRLNHSALLHSDPAENGWRIDLHNVPFEQLRALELEDDDRALPPPGHTSPAAAGEPVPHHTPARETRAGDAGIFAHHDMISR